MTPPYMTAFGIQNKSVFFFFAKTITQCKLAQKLRMLTTNSVLAHTQIVTHDLHSRCVMIPEMGTMLSKVWRALATLGRRGFRGHLLLWRALWMHNESLCWKVFVSLVWLIFKVKRYQFSSFHLASIMTHHAVSLLSQSLKQHSCAGLECVCMCACGRLLQKHTSHSPALTPHRWN